MQAFKNNQFKFLVLLLYGLLLITSKRPGEYKWLDELLLQSLLPELPDLWVTLKSFIDEEA